MSLSTCALSGSPLQDPVISIKTGHLFERSLIEKYIESTGECPITHQNLSKSDLISVQTASPIKPRPVNTSGVPQLLTILQNEWDSLMLETFSLKQHLETVRQELSHALYQHDAACRVIARLIRERDEARSLLTATKSNFNEENKEIRETNNNFNENIVQAINDKAIELNTLRKERKKKQEQYLEKFPRIENISNWQVKSTVSLHSATKPGINCLDIHQNQNELFLTGGNDHSVLIYNGDKSQIVGQFQKHNKKINDVCFIPDSQTLLGCSVSDDHYGHVFRVEETGEIEVKYSINCHKSPLVGVGLHPLGYLQAYAGKDGSWSFHDSVQGRLLFKNEDFKEKDINYSSVKIHPDGHILALGGSDGNAKLYNILENSLVEELPCHKNEISSICFSENGYYFATGSVIEGVVNVWDLRKLSLVKSLLNDENDSFKFKSFEFDFSGQYLAIGGLNSVKIVNTKNWEEITNFKAHKDVVNCIKFGANSSFMASGSMDRHLNVYSI